MNEDYWRLTCWQTYLDVWGLFKQHWKESPVNWESVHKKAHEIRRKHPTRMCEDLLLAMICELERQKDKK